MDIRNKSFPIRFPCNGRLDDFLNAVNTQRPLTPLIDLNEFYILINGKPLDTANLSRIKDVTAIRMVTTENQKYASIKMDLFERLTNKRPFLRDALNAAYDDLPEEGNIDDIPYLSQYTIDTFVENAIRIYDAAHHYVNPEDRYLKELFENLLYNEIRSAAFAQPEGASQNIYTTHDIKRCFFPDEICFDLNGETMVIKTASDYYRNKLKKDKK